MMAASASSKSAPSTSPSRRTCHRTPGALCAVGAPADALKRPARTRSTSLRSGASESCFDLGSLLGTARDAYACFPGTRPSSPPGRSLGGRAVPRYGCHFDIAGPSSVRLWLEICARPPERPAYHALRASRKCAGLALLVASDPPGRVRNPRSTLRSASIAGAVFADTLSGVPQGKKSRHSGCASCRRPHADRDDVSRIRACGEAASKGAWRTFESPDAPILTFETNVAASLPKPSVLRRNGGATFRAPRCALGSAHRSVPPCAPSRARLPRRLPGGLRTSRGDFRVQSCVRRCHEPADWVQRGAFFDCLRLGILPVGSEGRGRDFGRTQPTIDALQAVPNSAARGLRMRTLDIARSRIPRVPLTVEFLSVEALAHTSPNPLLRNR